MFGGDFWIFYEHKYALKIFQYNERTSEKNISIFFLYLKWQLAITHYWKCNQICFVIFNGNLNEQVLFKFCLMLILQGLIKINTKQHIKQGKLLKHKTNKMFIPYCMTSECSISELSKHCPLPLTVRAC